MGGVTGACGVNAGRVHVLSFVCALHASAVTDADVRGHQVAETSQARASGVSAIGTWHATQRRVCAILLVRWSCEALSNNTRHLFRPGSAALATQAATGGLEACFLEEPGELKALVRS